MNEGMMRHRFVAEIGVTLMVLGLGAALGARDAGLTEPVLNEAQEAALSAVKGAVWNTLLTSGVSALATYVLAIVTAFSVLYFGLWTKRVLNELLHTLACLSPLNFLLLIYAGREALGQGFTIFLALSIYPFIGRQLLARVAEEVDGFQFMQAKILGHGPFGVFRHYALPKFVPLTLPYFFFGLIYALLLESMFSSLGLLEVPGGPTWGLLIHEGTDGLLDDPWPVFYSGAAIMGAILIASACIPVVDRLFAFSRPKAA